MNRRELLKSCAVVILPSIPLVFTDEIDELYNQLLKSIRSCKTFDNETRGKPDIVKVIRWGRADSDGNSLMLIWKIDGREIASSTWIVGDEKAINFRDAIASRYGLKKEYSIEPRNQENFQLT